MMYWQGGQRCLLSHYKEYQSRVWAKKTVSDWRVDDENNDDEDGDYDEDDIVGGGGGGGDGVMSSTQACGHLKGFI